MTPSIALGAPSSMIFRAREGVEERFNALPEIRWPTFEWFLRKGVPAHGLIHPELPKRAGVVFREKQALFDFADDLGEDGVDALIFLARDELGNPLDLVASSPSPRKLGSWYGAAALLGANDILAPRMTLPGALRVHRTPLSWLQAERSGVVIIEPRRAAIELRDFGPLAVEDAAHGHELRALFREREPEIFVPNVERRTAP